MEKVDNNKTYLWEVKPASYSVDPKRQKGIDQLQGYVDSEPNYAIGNSYIENDNFQYGKYKVTYENAGNGLILYRFIRNNDDDKDPDVPGVIPKEDDKDGTGGRPSNVIEFPVNNPKIPDDVAAISPDIKADAIAEYIIRGAATIAVIVYMDRYLSVKPSELTAMYLAGLLSPEDYLIFMEPVFGVEVYAAEFEEYMPETPPGQDKSDDAASGGVGSMEDLYSDWSKIISPLAVNLDGTGIETISLNNGVYFDHQDTGFRTKTGWVAPNTGLLVHGVNENSKTISGRNLFGDNTLLKNGKLAANGFEALKDLDDNGDGIFDELDAAFFELYIWFDSNSNGKINTGELVPFMETGIVFINLNYVNSDFVDSNGNAFKQISTAVLEDNNVVDVIDIWFVRDVKDSKAVDRVKVNDEIKALPQIRGFGTTYSLRQAMMLDSSGQLQALVEQFVTETNESERKKLVPRIIYKWTGKTTNLAAIEALTGVKYTGGTGTYAMEAINKDFDSFAGIIYEVLMSQSHYKHLYRKMYIIDNTDTDPVYNLSAISYEMLCVLFDDQETGEKLLVDFITNMHTLRMFNSVDLGSFQEMFAAYDYRYGLIADIANKNIFLGMNVTNNLTGTSGNDAFISRTGNNTINGGYGDDTFFFDKNSGTNTFINAGGDNTIILSGVNPDDMDIKKSINAKNKYNVEITFTSCTGKIIIQDYDYNAEYVFVFPNGSLVDIAEYFPTVDIATVDELRSIQNNMDGKYRLVADIDMAGIDWIPIGTSTMPFCGMLDGNGHSIKNLSINLTAQDYVGLFGYSKGTVKNLTIEGAEVKGRSCTGILAGYSDWIIADCTMNGVKVLSGTQYVGGLTGYNAGTVEDSEVSEVATMSGSNAYVGGITGYNGGSVTNAVVSGITNLTGYNYVGGIAGYNGGTITESVADGIGTLKGTYTSNSYTGGFTGYNVGTISECSATGIQSLTGAGSYIGGFIGYNKGTIKKCYATGNVKGTQRVGGFVGSMEGGTIEQCYATGNVEGTSYLGGFAGQISGANSAIRNSFSLGNVLSGNNTAGFVGYISAGKVENCYSTASNINGFNNGKAATNSYFDSIISGNKTKAEGRTTTDMKKTATYTGWDFETIWEINNGYPTLQGLTAPEKSAGIYIDIYTAEDLSNIRKNLFGVYRLMSDINLSGIEWAPIGTSAAPFVGVLDGNSHSIKDLSINLSQDYVGLFGYSKGTVKNLTIEGAEVKGKSYTGIMTGYSSGTITDCTVKGAAVLNGTQYVGGITGYNNGTITESVVDGIGFLESSYTNSNYIGGFTGYNVGTVSECSATGIQFLTGASSYSGGFIGYNSGTIKKCCAMGMEVNGTLYTGGFIGGMGGGTIEQCYATGDVYGIQYAGGFVGIMVGGTIEQCYATGNVEGISYRGGYLGGFAGQLTGGNNVIRNSFSLGDVMTGIKTAGFVGNISSGKVENCYSTASNPNGFHNNSMVTNCYYDSTIAVLASKEEGCSSADMMKASTYTGWDFEEIWELEEGKSYPYLRGMDRPENRSY